MDCVAKGDQCGGEGGTPNLSCGALAIAGKGGMRVGRAIEAVVNSLRRIGVRDLAGDCIHSSEIPTISFVVKRRNSCIRLVCNAQVAQDKAKYKKKKIGFSIVLTVRWVKVVSNQ